MIIATLVGTLVALCPVLAYGEIDDIAIDASVADIAADMDELIMDEAPIEDLDVDGEYEDLEYEEMPVIRVTARNSSHEEKGVPAESMTPEDTDDQDDESVDELIFEDDIGADDILFEDKEPVFDGAEDDAIAKIEQEAMESLLDTEDEKKPVEVVSHLPAGIDEIADEETVEEYDSVFDEPREPRTLSDEEEVVEEDELVEEQLAGDKFSVEELAIKDAATEITDEDSAKVIDPDIVGEYEQDKITQVDSEEFIIEGEAAVEDIERSIFDESATAVEEDTSVEDHVQAEVAEMMDESVEAEIDAIAAIAMREDSHATPELGRIEYEPAEEAREVPEQTRDISAKGVRSVINKQTAATEIHIDSIDMSVPLVIAAMQNKEMEIVRAKKEITRLRGFIDRIAVANRREQHIMHYNMGCVYRSASMYKKAESEFLKALEKDSSDPDVHFNLAVLYDDDLRVPDKARKHYEKFLQLSPDDKDAAQVQEWLISIQ